MKRLILSLALILIIAGICGAETAYIKDFCQKNLNDIEECERQYSVSREQSVNLGEKFKDNWEERQSFLILFVNHSFIDEISIEAVKLPCFSKNGTNGDFYACCASIKRTLHQIEEDQRITIDTFY